MRKPGERQGSFSWQPPRPRQGMEVGWAREGNPALLPPCAPLPLLLQSRQKLKAFSLERDGDRSGGTATGGRRVAPLAPHEGFVCIYNLKKKSSLELWSTAISSLCRLIELKFTILEISTWFSHWKIRAVQRFCIKPGSGEVARHPARLALKSRSCCIRLEQQSVAKVEVVKLN